MAINNFVSIYFFHHSLIVIYVFDCNQSGVRMSFFITHEHRLEYIRNISNHNNTFYQKTH